MQPPHPGSPSTVKIAPSILSADFGYLADAVQQAEQGGADWIHVDVMDGDFVPNITFGPAAVQALRRATSLPLDVHLMVRNPARYIQAFHQAGADLLTIHVEADDHPHRTLAAIRDLGAQAGLALNPGTPLSAAEELLPSLDLLLVMSVDPGFGGQSFIPTSSSKLQRARALLSAHGASCELEVDGGIKASNAEAAVQAGASVLVAGSFVYENESGVGAALRSLRAEITSAGYATRQV